MSDKIGLIDRIQNASARTKTMLGICAVVGTLLLYAVTVYLGSRRHPFFVTAERVNGWAIWLSVSSITAVGFLWWFIQQSVPAAAPDTDAPSFAPPRRVQAAGLLLGALAVAICLPATFRAFDHPREVQIFWHDEGITLEIVHEFIVGDAETPTRFRYTQGWVSFLPVALVLKVVNALVPVHYAVTNIALRSYQLAMVFLMIYFTYRLIWQITRSWWMAVAVVLIAYSRREFFHISLAIDRPDTFQLVFVVLSLIFAHRFWLAGRPTHWFLAVFFAASAFASKYSGHLLAPVLLLPFIAHWLRPEVQAAYPTFWKRWLVGGAIFSLSFALIFSFTFFILSPYHLIRLEEVIHFFSTHLYIYRSGNVYNLPNYEMPSNVLLWWDVFTSNYAFDYWLTVLGAAGAAAALIRNLVWRSREPRALGELLLLSWGACYFSFLLYQYALVDYRYIMPAQYVLPYFLLAPVLWLQQASPVGRVPYRTALGFGMVACTLLLCTPRVNGTLSFLAAFRSEQSNQASYDVGRYLDRTVAIGDNPKILMTNLAYIPPRFTDLMIHNVDITPAFLEKYRFDFVIMTENMYGVYADKPTAGCEKQFCPLYKVHFVDVVDTYTKFKHHAHADYRHVISFQDYHLFERIHRDDPDNRDTSSR